MSKMYKTIFLCGIIFLCYSCGIIQINENNYDKLTEKDKKKIKTFNESLSNEIGSTSFAIYEINTTEIKNQLKKNNFTWVHLWAPYCKGDECKRLSYYTELKKKYSNFNLKIYVTSIFYDVTLINEIVLNNKYEEPIYVLQNSYFGKNMSKAQKKLNQELTNTQEKKWFSEYLFKDTILLYKGYDINGPLLDSLIKM